jgi:hypothetical protein
MSSSSSAAGDYYARDIKGVDFRANPELYRIGRGEQGVLMVEPYKGEILPHWRFRTPEVAQVSADKIYAMYLDYKADGDFVGMDMARKFLQMGYTRARRYANHPGGRKYKPGTREVLPFSEDKTKGESALIFRAKWDAIKADADYVRMLKVHKE